MGFLHTRVRVRSACCCRLLRIAARLAVYVEWRMRRKNPKPQATIFPPVVPGAKPTMPYSTKPWKVSRTEAIPPESDCSNCFSPSGASNSSIQYTKPVRMSETMISSHESQPKG